MSVTQDYKTVTFSAAELAVVVAGLEQQAIMSESCAEFMREGVGKDRVLAKLNAARSALRMIAL